MAHTIHGEDLPVVVSYLQNVMNFDKKENNVLNEEITSAVPMDIHFAWMLLYSAINIILNTTILFFCPMLFMFELVCHNITF